MMPGHFYYRALGNVEADRREDHLHVAFLMMVGNETCIEPDLEKPFR